MKHEVYAKTPQDLAKKLFELDPPQCEDFHRWKKEQRERLHFSRLMSSLARGESDIFPMRVVHDDKPDFLAVLMNGRNIGVETTELEQRNFRYVRAQLTRHTPSELMDISLPAFAPNAMKFDETNTWQKALYLTPEELKQHNDLIDDCELTNWEKVDPTAKYLRQGPSFGGDDARRDWLAALRRLVDNKLAALNAYAAVPEYWLVVADHWPTSRWKPSFISPYTRGEPCLIPSGLSLTYSRLCVITERKLLDVMNGSSLIPLIDHWRRLIGQ